MEAAKGAEAIKSGKTALGIELGSTRIKAVLVNEDCETLASADYGWENQLEKGIWTYELSEAWKGIQACFAGVAKKAEEVYGEKLKKVGAIGISAMMHGYLPFDKDGKQLAGFRTWRNNITGEAAKILSDEFKFNIPQRWSIAHLYQAILNGEKEVGDIAFITTLAGYVHWKLCGEKVLGIGDASGMFPIDVATGNYDKGMRKKFEKLDKIGDFPWKLEEILPKVLPAGENAGKLTEEGARLLDPSGALEAGSFMAPPEGDAGTGMVATNSIRKRTGNISAGTSAFSMNVLDAPMKGYHQDIDVVTTPDGAAVAMIHSNNCTSDLNAWVGLFKEFAEATGKDLKSGELYGTLLKLTEKADIDAGGLVNYSCLAGETVTKVDEGRPMFVRTPHSKMNLPNFILSQLYGAFAPLKIGMDVLMGEEGIEADAMVAQGGLFQTPVIGQQVLANMIGIPVTVMETAGEGGPWGMAVLAVYGTTRKEGESLPDFLDKRVFKDAKKVTLSPQPEGAKACQAFIEAYKSGLDAERAAGKIADYKAS